MEIVNTCNEARRMWLTRVYYLSENLVNLENFEPLTILDQSAPSVFNFVAWNQSLAESNRFDGDKLERNIAQVLDGVVEEQKQETQFNTSNFKWNHNAVFLPHKGHIENKILFPLVSCVCSILSAFYHVEIRSKQSLDNDTEPDFALYINGICVGFIELKSLHVKIHEIDNKSRETPISQLIDYLEVEFKNNGHNTIYGFLTNMKDCVIIVRNRQGFQIFKRLLPSVDFEATFVYLNKFMGVIRREGLGVSVI